ncbi:MAG TPA: hypothetical protein VFC26_09000 [Verrucomicrobiae bacterium]|nr:hypothetical protein [Verrucomicrobiae bacterium]
MIYNYVMIFGELIAAPFSVIHTIFGIVPLYFGLVVNEITSAKANYKTAVQTGFSFLWAGMQWLYPHFKSSDGAREALGAMLPINLLVTGAVLGLGILALVSGIRKRYPEKCQFLGHSRFSNYFMITIYPMQAQVLDWTWERLIALTLFAFPIWLILQLIFEPFRSRR